MRGLSCNLSLGCLRLLKEAMRAVVASKVRAVNSMVKSWKHIDMILLIEVFDMDNSIRSVSEDL